MKQNLQNRIIATAAKTHLAPLGCKRQGQSRLWYLDQRYWAIVIEFQPSGLNKGSYLNVAASWLWFEQDHWSFDYGGRIGGFVRFDNEHQFEEEANCLALSAAESVGELRQDFASIEQIASRLMALVAKGEGGLLWSQYHAAIAAGLIGDLAGARQLFRQLASASVEATWVEQLQTVATGLSELLSDPDQFRSSIQQIVNTRRAKAKLPPDPIGLLEALP
jgi:hypothetical protein